MDLSCDSCSEKTVAAVDDRFASGDESTLALELEIKRANILRDAHQMVACLRERAFPVCNGWINSLELIVYPIEDNVEVGKDAQIGLFVHDFTSNIETEFEGSGKISFDQNGKRAILQVKTSESMIPDGQSEAYIPYNATAKVPKADGTYQRMKTKGKFKIRRPCIAQ